MKKISKPELWGAVFIVLAVFTAYRPVVHGGFIWDDDDYVTHNQTLRHLNGLREIWFNPAATPPSITHWSIPPSGWNIIYGG